MYQKESKRERERKILNNILFIVITSYRYRIEKRKYKNEISKIITRHQFETFRMQEKKLISLKANFLFMNQKKKKKF